MHHLWCRQGSGQFDALNANIRQRGALVEEGVRVIKALLGGEPFDSELGGGSGELGLRPEQSVQWRIGGAPSVRAIARVARIGNSW